MFSPSSSLSQNFFSLTRLCFIALFFLFPESLSSQTVLRNGYYLDIAAKKAIPFSIMVIEDGKITRIDKEDEDTGDNPQTTEIDLQGKYLSPGLIDSFSQTLPSEPESLTRSGITAAAVLGNNNPGPGRVSRGYAYFHFPSLPREKQKGDILYSGPLIVYRDQEAIPPSDKSFLLEKITEQKSISAVSGVEDLEEIFHDWDKTPPSLIYVEAHREGAKAFPQLLWDLLITEAEVRGLKVIARTETSGDALHAAEQGADLIAMNLGAGIVEEELLELAGRGIPLITSVFLYQGYGKEYRREEEGEALSRDAKANLKLFLNAGGRVLIGSSYGAPWVKAGPPLQEIAIYRELGVSDATLFEILTQSPLEALGFLSPPHATNQPPPGRIAPGYDADLIVTRENPLENIDTLTDIRMVINNGHLIRNEESSLTPLEVDIAYTPYFTRREMVIGSLMPNRDSYPQTIHVTLSPLYGGTLMEDGLGRFDFGLFSRWILPSSWAYHQVDLSISTVFYEPVLFHLVLDYLHFFTPHWGLGFKTSILPRSHYIAGAHVKLQRIPYFYTGSKQWFTFDAHVNFEEYVVEEAQLFTIRTLSTFDLYDFLPPVISGLNFHLGLEGAMSLDQENNYLQESFDLNIGIHLWKNLAWDNQLWQKQLWGSPLQRFRLQESDGYLKSMSAIGPGRAYNETDFKDALIGWLTELNIHFLSFSIFDFRGGLFWEMQKRDSSFSKLFRWDEKWVMDFGVSLTLSLGAFGVTIGVYTPLTPKGSPTIPGVFGGITIL